jgi:hypothetical protein
VARVQSQGLLYLPSPYVVPGGRFNEMYGWDSYFIQLGLLRDGEVILAKDMADNFLYEIREYGKILNANWTVWRQLQSSTALTRDFCYRCGVVASCMLPVEFRHGGRQKREATEFGNQTRTDPGDRGAVPHRCAVREEDPRRVR